MLNEKAVIYYIEYEGKPIYIGSTTNLENRQKGHNKELQRAILENGSSVLLYDFLYNKIKSSTSFKSIKLLPIKEIYNDMVLISEYRVEWRRYIEEEKAIRLCLKKGLQLLNMIWPCKSWITNSGKLLKRDSMEDLKIPLNNKYETNEKLYLEIYNFIKTRSVKEEIPIEVTPVFNEYIMELFSEELIKYKINFNQPKEKEMNVEDLFIKNKLI